MKNSYSRKEFLNTTFVLGIGATVPFLTSCESQISNNIEPYTYEIFQKEFQDLVRNLGGLKPALLSKLKESGFMQKDAYLTDEYKRRIDIHNTKYSNQEIVRGSNTTFYIYILSNQNSTP